MDVLGLLLRLGKPPLLFVHTPVFDLPLHRIFIVGKLPLNPLQIGQPWTIDVFVDHARRHQRHVTRTPRERRV